MKKFPFGEVIDLERAENEKINLGWERNVKEKKTNMAVGGKV